MTLRTRLLLAAGLLLAVVASGAVVLVHTQRRYLTDQVDDQLRAARPLVQFGPPAVLDPPPGSVAPSDADAPISSLIIGVVDGGRLTMTLQGQLVEDVPVVGPDVAQIAEAVDGGPITLSGTDGDTRFRSLLVQGADAGPVSVIALPLDEVDRAVSRLRWTLGAVAGAVAAVLLLAVWWVQRLGLRPIARLTDAAGAIAAGERGHRVLGADRHTEAGQLAGAFNVMLDERDATEERLRQFVADASHELRTPLTSIRGYLDLYGDGGFRTEVARNDMVRRMSQEAARMHDLVEDLLLLANLDQHRPLRCERVDLGRLVRDAAADAGVLQPQRPIIVSLVGAEPIETIGDAFRLQQVVGALVANAVAYTDADDEVELAVRRTGDGTEIVVADTGPGLAPADAARAFDRFWRGDHSRARGRGGSGLGLAIARSIVEAHAGTIDLRTAPGQGCRFVIALPHRTVGVGYQPS